MENDLPYLVTPKKFPLLLDKIQAAAVPPKFTANILKKLGFPSSNDRAFISLLKRLGMLNENGQPTERYAQYRNKGKAKSVLADGIREAYSDLFDVHTDIYEESIEEIKSAVNSVSGREQKFVNLIANTFKMLCDCADFSIGAPEVFPPDPPVTLPKPAADNNESQSQKSRDVDLPGMSFNYNIEIHLPATTDIAVYNAIFRSLRDSLGRTQ